MEMDELKEWLLGRQTHGRKVASHCATRKTVIIAALEAGVRRH